MDMFTNDVDAIFAEAGVKKEDNEDAYAQCLDILSTLMARGSVTEGLTYERARQYERQKTALIEDLKAWKKDRPGEPL